MSEAFVLEVFPHTDEHDESCVARRADVLVTKSRASPNDIDDPAIVGTEVQASRSHKHATEGEERGGARRAGKSSVCLWSPNHDTTPTRNLIAGRRES